MSAAKSVARREREQEWRERLARWSASGQSAAGFAAGEQVSVASLYQWRRRLCANAADSQRPRFVAVRVRSSEAVLEVVSGQWLVRVGPNFDAAHLRAVLAALAAPPC